MARPTATNRELPRLLTAKELADHLGSVSPQRIYRLTREGLIPHIRLGRAVRFSAESIAEWIAAGGTGPLDADPEA